jgi:flagellar biosynthesis/type III secretory pathway protein FliH
VLDELEKGSAIVESADGIVEASIDTQLKNLKEMVLNKNAG